MHTNINITSFTRVSIFLHYCLPSTPHASLPLENSFLQTNFVLSPLVICYSLTMLYSSGKRDHSVSALLVNRSPVYGRLEKHSNNSILQSRHYFNMTGEQPRMTSKAVSSRESGGVQILSCHYMEGKYKYMYVHRI